MKWISINWKIIIGVILILLLFYGVIYIWNTQRKIKYIDTITLFNEFKLTKELEARDAPVLNAFKSKLDSMQQVYSLLKNPTQRNQLGLTIYQFDNEYKAYSEKSNKEINELVWTRLNKFIHQYGALKDFSLLIGANGMGNVLYADKNRDETQALINYCNKMYKDER